MEINDDVSLEELKQNINIEKQAIKDMANSSSSISDNERTNLTEEEIATTVQVEFDTTSDIKAFIEKTTKIDRKKIKKRK